MSSVDISSANHTIVRMKVGDIGEWKLIEVIRKKLELPGLEEVLVDIGDDAACVRLEGLSILTIDSYLEDVHFNLHHYGFSDIGYRSLACSLSDVAAMGGHPKFALISLQIPPDTSVEDVGQLYSGMLELAHRFHFRIVGGDTVRSEGIGIVCAIIGQTDVAIERRGAKVGDSILVTGDLGSSSFGLYLMKAGINRPESASLIETHKKPFPRIDEGWFLCHSGVVNAMIDISDGLAMDLHHLAKESGVGAVIHFEKLPVTEELYRLADGYGEAASDFILYGGEDYELLLTVPPEQQDKICRGLRAKTGTRITEIGRIVQEKRVELDRNGERNPLPRQGYDHFKMEP